MDLFNQKTSPYSTLDANACRDIGILTSIECDHSSVGTSNMNDDDAKSGTESSQETIVSSTTASQISSVNFGGFGESEELLESASNRKRKRVADPAKWKSNIQKEKKMRGEAYTGRKRSGSKFVEVPKPAKQMGPSCSSSFCRKCKFRKCVTFSDDDRMKIFQEFWNMKTGEKKAFIKSLVEQDDVRKPSDTSKRATTFSYYLKKDGRNQQVCRAMFMNTLSIKENQLRNYILKPVKPARSNSIRGPMKKEETLELQSFLRNLPKIPSHYCRATSSKLYLEPVFKSKADVFRHYQNHCLNKSLKPLSVVTFDRVWKIMNISLFQPKKDQCDVCCSMNAGNLTESKYSEHVVKKTAARNEKITDKALALKGSVHVICMDVQSVLLCPMLQASSFYFKTKLAVHNFTIYDMKTRNATCFVWDESQGGLVASVFASCLIRYLEQFKDDLPIIIYSDGCTCQNRNAILANALLDFSLRKQIVVTQKFLEKGHTQMEVDSVHSCIERKLKGQPIYLPEDYGKICVAARKLNPYEVIMPKHTDFINYAAPDTLVYKSIRPGKSLVTDIRQLKYDKDGTVAYKLSHDAPEWTMMPKRTVSPSSTFPPLYNAQINITKRKYEDLMSLLNVIPTQFHDFFQSLPHD